jgi:hypothetical protein
MEPWRKQYWLDLVCVLTEAMPECNVRGYSPAWGHGELERARTHLGSEGLIPSGVQGQSSGQRASPQEADCNLKNQVGIKLSCPI